MNTVYVLIALVYSGNFTNTIVPTMEFSTMEKCQTAIKAFDAESQGQQGTARFRCVRIEK